MLFATELYSLNTAVEVARRVRVGQLQSPADDVFALAPDYGITGYDAQFVALAQELHCTLYTQDKEILAKFPTLAKPFYRKH